MAQVDEVILHQVQECQQCHAPLESEPSEIVERRQVIDFPNKRLWVTEHQIEEKCCPVCGYTSQAAFPEDVRARAQYGPYLQALGVYLVEGQMIPYARASQLLREVFGLQVSAGSLVGWVRTCSQALAPVETRIKAGLRKAGVIHQDETGVRVRKHHSYVHVCSTPQLTHFGYHPSRGRSALNDIGILAGFDGTSIHDGYKIYPGYPCHHALCNVHHLRELTFVEEELKQPWATKMKALLLDMKEKVAQARATGQTQLDVITLANFHFQYGALISLSLASFLLWLSLFQQALKLLDGALSLSSIVGSTRVRSSLSEIGILHTLDLHQIVKAFLLLCILFRCQMVSLLFGLALHELLLPANERQRENSPFLQSLTYFFSKAKFRLSKENRARFQSFYPL